MDVFSTVDDGGPRVEVIRRGLLLELFGNEAFVETIFEFETRIGGDERIVIGEDRFSSNLYGLKEDFL